MSSTHIPRRTALLSMLALASCGGGGGSGAAADSAGDSSGSTSGALFADYNPRPLTPDSSGMADNAWQTALKIRRGFNIGNTLEATPGRSETAWGNPVISREFVASIKAAGFDAVRLPVSWHQYANASTAAIDAAWLARVKQVVQYCLDADLYVLVNIHWDGGWLEENVTAEKQAAVNARQKAYWQQIATALRDADGRLMFASANEPNVRDAAQMAVLMSYHQTFIDAVRATGGRNAYRVLVVQGPSTDIERTSTLMSGWPVDSQAGRLMAEVHYYTPWNFTGMTRDESWGNQFFYWGSANHSTTDTAHNPTWGEEDRMQELLAMMKTRFIDRGIPLLIGEFGAMRRSELSGPALELHLASRLDYYRTLTRKARALGLLPFVWDTGELLDRSRNTVRDPDLLAALMSA